MFIVSFFFLGFVAFSVVDVVVVVVVLVEEGGGVILVIRNEVEEMPKMGKKKTGRGEPPVDGLP